MHIDIQKIRLNEALGSSDPVSLVKQKKYRNHPVEGDLFAFQVQEYGWYTGRVIKHGPSTYPGSTEGMFEDIYLVYFYNTQYQECPCELRSPIKPSLLLPPTIVDRSLWLMGFIKPIGNFSLLEEEVLPRHCFWHYPKKRFHDEYGKRILEPFRPCGTSSVTLVDGVLSRLARSLRDGFDQDNHPLS